MVGRSGVEATYDQLLRGHRWFPRCVGGLAWAGKWACLGNEPAVPGQDLRLTIDLDVQRAAENALGDRDGSIVALDPHTGDVLAMVSRPTFDPNAVCCEDRPQRTGTRWSPIPTIRSAEQGDSGAARAGLHLQDHHVGGRSGRAVIAQNLKVDCQGGATLLRAVLCLRRARHGDVEYSQRDPVSPATPTTTHWRKG